MSTHPAEVNDRLDRAIVLLDKMITEAETRGDRDGADAWLAARLKVEEAYQHVRNARAKQTWK